MVNKRELTLPFIHLNLRFNPFGELPLKYRAKLSVIDSAPFIAHLGKPRAVLQFLGDKGHGKTTHLLTLRNLLPGSGYVHFPEDIRPKIPSGSPLLLDEAQRISWWVRRRVFKGTQSLVLGTHRDFSDELTKCGRKVWTIQAGIKTDRIQLDKIVRKRIEFARRQAGEVPVVPMNTIDKLLYKFGADIRAIEGCLYDLLQSLEGPCNVEM